ncbi:WD40 domain containing protein [Histomonas meleagridis]|uniref:WD40 domain containing protein n=1 Tax=Histomonas meleagridis TaxID=135588 RepID=UPI003559E80D|nr:WD40 domain containing protein [Histomonas meleagridis]KAH0798418.1 WD40 domain containing protein [Histomonas meleagridis]
MKPKILKAFNVRNGELTCAIPFTNRYIAGGTTGKSIILFPLNKQDTCQRLVGHHDTITCIDASNSQSLIITGSKDEEIRFWKVIDNNDSCIKKLSPHFGSIKSLSITQDADQVLILGGSSSLSLFDINTQQIIQKFPITDKELSSTAISLYSSLVATGSIDGKCRLYDIRSCNILHTFDTYSNILSLSFSGGGDNLAAGTSNGSLFLCESKFGSILHSSKIHSDSINSVAIQPNGNIIVTGSSDNSVIITDTNNFESIFTLSAHEKDVIDVKFSSDGKYFTTCGRDRKVIYWLSPDLSVSPEEEEISTEEPSLDFQEPKVGKISHENTFLSQDSVFRNTQTKTKKRKKPKRNCLVRVVKCEERVNDPYQNFLSDIANELDKLSVRLGKITKRVKHNDERIKMIELKSK